MTHQHSIPHTAASMPHSYAITLERQDLITYEQRLRAALANFVPHTAYSLYFPGDGRSAALDYIPAERKLLIPLWEPLLEQPFAPGPEAPPPLPRQLLGVFVARGVKASVVRPLMKLLPRLAALTMENLLLHKASLCDPATGLFTRQQLTDSIAREATAIREELRPQVSMASMTSQASLSGDDPRPPQPSCPEPRPETRPDPLRPEGSVRPCLGVLALRLRALRDIAREHGYLTADSMMLAVADVLRELCPPQAVAARTGDFECAVLLPAATGKTCRGLAERLIQAVAAIHHTHALTRKRVTLAPAAGYALYPQDMGGRFFVTPPAEQARLLLRHARHAAALAAESAYADADLPVMGFSHIVAEGGRIIQPMPLSRVLISLGSAVNAREGQRFSVWADTGARATSEKQGRALIPQAESAPDGVYKGEIVLMELRHDTALAEIVHLGDPAWGLEPGDHLMLLPGELPPTLQPGGTYAGLDPLTGLLRHGDFLARWTAEREKSESFALGLLHFASADNQDSSHEDEAAGAARQPDKLMGEAVRLCHEFFGQHTLGGRYGLTSLVFFHPQMNAEKAEAAYTELCRLLSERLFSGTEHSIVAAGIACYPYLNFRKSDMLENSRKALEYALLLPRPHVGVFDSLALTISADKQFSTGDSFRALEEYKQALLADDANTLAWNSLGVCLAALGRHDEARRYFHEALTRQTQQAGQARQAGHKQPQATPNPYRMQWQEQDSVTQYNLGYSSQCLGELREAKTWYKRCLRLDPRHMYALIRMGQIAEAEKNPARARSLYLKAGALPGGAALSRRHLAALCLAQGKRHEARELLHETLAYDPQNAMALQMLARIYLEGGEDVGVAESLARQSVALRPSLKAAWLALAQALEAQGRHGESREARLKAGEL